MAELLTFFEAVLELKAGKTVARLDPKRPRHWSLIVRPGQKPMTFEINSDATVAVADSTMTAGDNSGRWWTVQQAEIGLVWIVSNLDKQSDNWVVLPYTPAAKPAQGTKMGTQLFSFAVALTSLKEGRRIAREGWNGKGMWLVLIDPGNAMFTKFGVHAPMQPCIGMYTATSDMQPGWLANQADLLAMDWWVLPD